jgi:Zn-dependent protease
MPSQDDEEAAPQRMQGAFRLFELAGITVFLHWSWLFVAVIEVQHRSSQYKSMLFNVVEYLALFALVLMHEFGHSLACRSVGGKADRILLWPLGGVAFVNPPQRPGATLWSIVAGPLVNVIMVPVLIGVGTAMGAMGVWKMSPDAFALWRAVSFINIALLIFNLMPVYPLDGGQILRSLLWFPLGRANSLLITAIFGLVGVVLLILLALILSDIWLGIVAAFVLLSCWSGIRSGIAMARIDRLPRHEGVACPGCGAAPFVGTYWQCNRCQTAFDTFTTNATCPNCGTIFLTTLCAECGESNPLSKWKDHRPPTRRN